MVGIVGSARKGGNTDALVQAVLEGCERAGAQTEKIRLDDLEIKPCRACRTQDGKGCRKGMLICVSGSDGPEHAWAALEEYWADEINLEVVIRKFACETVGDDGEVLEPRERPRAAGRAEVLRRRALRSDSKGMPAPSPKEA